MFPEEMVWAAKSIEGTNYAEYSVNGKPTTRYFKGWLRLKFLFKESYGKWEKILNVTENTLFRKFPLSNPYGKG